MSKHLEETTSTITAGLVGSPAYMSPEQAIVPAPLPGGVGA